MYRSSTKTVFSAKSHLSLRLKDRRRILAGRAEVRLKEVIVQVVGEVGGEPMELQVMPDHLHLLVEVPLPVPLSKLGRPLPALWSPTWFVSTVGGAPLLVVGCDVEDQKRVA